MAGKFPEWRCIAKNVTDFYGPFCSTPGLITGDLYEGRNVRFFVRPLQNFIWRTCWDANQHRFEWQISGEPDVVFGKHDMLESHTCTGSNSISTELCLCIIMYKYIYIYTCIYHHNVYVHVYRYCINNIYICTPRYHMYIYIYTYN